MTNEELVIRIKAGIDVADNMAALYEQNRGMIGKLAWRYRGMAEEEEEDLMQEGFLGLCNAVDAYDSSQGANFMTYAVFWIKQGMHRYIENCGSCVRIPVHQRQRIRDYKRIRQQYLKMLGREPAEWELCRLLDISLKVLHRIEIDSRNGQIESLDRGVGEEEDTSLGELVASGEDLESEVLDRIQYEELKDILWSLVDSLPGDQPGVIRARYQEGKTLKEISQTLGCHLSYVRQIEAKGFRELRRSSRSAQLRPFLYDGEAYRKGIQGTGVEAFNRTWTSATERAALR